MNHTSEPEITRSATRSTESLASGDASSSDDLPSVVVNQGTDTEATAILDVAVITDGDLDRIGKATLKSEGTGLGDIAPSSELVSVDTDHPAAAEAGFPTLRIDANIVVRDGVLPLAEEDTASTSPLFTPRGPLTKPSNVERPHKNTRGSEPKGKKGSKTKGSKDKPRDKPASSQNEKKQTGCIIM